MSVETKIIGVAGQPQRIADGAYADARMGNDSDLIISHLHGNYFEMARNGNIFLIDSDAVTLAAAHTTKGALATVKFINGFYNPFGSGVNAEIISALVATVSGTPAGGFFYNSITGVTMSNAATGTIRNALLGAKSSALQAAVNVILTIQGGGTTALNQIASIGGPAAIAAGAGVYSVYDDTEGKIIVPPGAFFGICATGAGTTHIVQSTLIVAEARLPS